MAKYDLIERLTTTFRELERGLHQLREQLDSYRLLVGRVFLLPDVEKGTEHEAVTEIEVKQRIGKKPMTQHFCISPDFLFSSSQKNSVAR